VEPQLEKSIYHHKYVASYCQVQLIQYARIFSRYWSDLWPLVPMENLLLLLLVYCIWTSELS
jgi:hypothetical protein